MLERLNSCAIDASCVQRPILRYSFEPFTQPGDTARWWTRVVQNGYERGYKARWRDGVEGIIHFNSHFSFDTTTTTHLTLSQFPKFSFAQLLHLV